MRIIRVGIEGFGALANDSLELGPGMTVVFGPNESAKTTLHAAIYAALCGMRRGRGQPRLEDRSFGDRHRPWGGGPWRVDALIELADGRQIELWHDLSGRVDCRAVDVGLGRRDVSAEIMSDGAPDGSRWLGFDRGSFVATACVRQSSIAAVLASANALQDELQRAAASAQRDETAGGAIEALRTFARDHVGQERKNSPRPLPRATVQLERAKADIDDARRQHEAYLATVGQVEGSERTRDVGRRRLRLAEAVLARKVADAATANAARASELGDRHPEEPAGVAGQGRLADEIAEALTRWEGCQPELDLSVDSIDSIEALESALAALPELPVGDLTPVQSVLDAEATLRAAESILAEHERLGSLTESARPIDVDPAELEKLAGALERNVLAVDTELRERVAQLRARVGSQAGGVARSPLLVGAVLALAGVVAAVTVSVPVAIALFVLGAVISGMAFWSARNRSDTAAAEALATAERMLEEQQRDADAASALRAEACRRLRELGLPEDAGSLRTLVAETHKASTAVAARVEWESRVVSLRASRGEAEADLRSALRGRSAGGEGDVAVELAAYKTACSERERQEREASVRPALEQRLTARRKAENDAAERAAAQGRLLEVVESLGVTEDDPARAAQRLREWQRAREGNLESHDDATKEWTELQQLRGDRTVDELAQAAAELGARATLIAEGLSPDELQAFDPGLTSDQLDELRVQVRELEQAAALARGQVEEMASGLPSVAEAEEGLAAAEREFDRVRGLDEVLKRTIAFLEQAQERVHRSIAPVLEQTLRTWLPRIVVSLGPDGIRERYDDVTVDPETLQVQVRQGAGAWRNAEFLSEGTKEQIFLLLRVALAGHLTKPGENTPLILDEITAQCDAIRRTALLNLLHELSAERQIILFTHDEGALAWAEERLDLNGGDALVRRDVLEEVGA